MRAGEEIAHYPKWRRSLLIRAETRDFHSRHGNGERSLGDDAHALNGIPADSRDLVQPPLESRSQTPPLYEGVDFLGILCVSNHVTHAYAHAHFSNERVIAKLRALCRAQGAGFG